MLANTAVIVGGLFDPAKEAELRERLRYPPQVAIEFKSGQDATVEFHPTRWTLKRVRAAFEWLADYTLSGIWRLLDRLGIHLRQGRPQLYSPDPDYEAKERRLLEVLSEAGSDDEVVTLFLDELTYYHWPLPAPDWAEMDGPPPQAERDDPGERSYRIVGALNAQTGRVTYCQAYKIDRWQFIHFLRQVAQEYPDAKCVHIVLDNWPVHLAEDVMTALAEEDELSRIQLVFLPTYSSWLNPIEKLWDWLKADALKMHRLAGQWDKVKQRVTTFLEQFAEGSDILIYRVGLAGDGKLAQAAQAA